MTAPAAAPLPPDEHEAVRGLLGAWALDACPPDETALLEDHLTGCAPCATEAARLRDAAGWLSADEPLDPVPELRSQVLEGCLGRRVPDVRVPGWASPYAAETAKLDALLRDLGPSEWLERAEVPWHGGTEWWLPAEVLCHLAAVDGFVGRAYGMDDLVPGGDAAPEPEPEPDRPWAAVSDRTERLISAHGRRAPEAVRALWREQTRALVRAAALAGPDGGGVAVDYGDVRIPARDAFVDRAFECWIHADDVARAVDYPYEPPSARHLRQMIDLAARMLPAALDGLRGGPHGGAEAGAEAANGRPRVVKLVIEGPAAGEWLIPLGAAEPPADAGPPPDSEPVASLAVDGLEFCYLAAAHRDPDRMAVGQHGDSAAVREMLHAAPLLSRP
ncbi:maleylpyruvate isomerase N-terminal domain-containing protein [Peterkaempfera bronchialis]|uniref:MDMPI N domain containing protein n=1 Tax=Peterkaempfera bronchialis TaxID=2126346 RepID=A0A345SWN1_9ACTN|nr:maleylpyruvate isomerase N-terminal domain-containing protein [Peterkaempfera bronchialis]AXI78136.1 MDMPI N domain containing protein [Peterkaempfera bronchialis]